MARYKVYSSKKNRAYSKEDARRSFNWGHEVNADSYSNAKKKSEKYFNIPAKKLSAIKL
jgi:hypothetical protein